MKKNGFSLMEIIIALLLTGVVSISLLKSQWQLNRKIIALIESTQDGFSLAELLMSLFISSFLILMTASQVGILQTHAKHFKEQANELIERLWLEDLVSGYVQRAGFSGCVGMDVKNALNIFDTHQLTLHFFEPVADKITAIQSGIIRLDGDIEPYHQNLEIRDCWHHEALKCQGISKHSLVLEKPLVNQYEFPELTYIGHMQHISFLFQNNHLYLIDNHAHDKLSEQLKDISFHLKDKSIEIDWLWQSGYQKHQVIKLTEAM